MEVERWQQIKAVFDLAVESDPESRAEFLRRHCSGDEDLRREVESLLASDAENVPKFDRLPIAALVQAIGSHRPVQLKAGQQVGNYVVTGEIESGGMGTVWRARHINLRAREAAIKCIRAAPQFVGSEALLTARFRREAHIQSQLDHPGIVRIYEFHVKEGQLYLVMEFVRGSSLRSILGHRGALSADHACSLAVQALEALTAAHTLHYLNEAGDPLTGVIHRDIKPANLLVDEHGTLKVTDFGIAKITGDVRWTRTGSNPGTLEYMSPEQILGREVDCRSDLYSLGITLYEMLSGRVPFRYADFSSDYTLSQAHLELEPPNLCQLNPAISTALAEVVACALRKDPDARFGTALEFRGAILEAQGCPSGQAVSRVTFTARDLTAQPRSRKLQRPMLWFAVAVLLPGAVAAAFLWLGQSGRISRSVAVLPFRDLSADHSQEYFADGLTEELTSGLAKIPEIRVAGTTSSAQFKATAADPHTIAQTLGVATFLEGSVRPDGDHVRIAVRLIKALDGFPLWSETFDRPQGEIVDVQEEIGQHVAASLRVKLGGRKTAPQRTNVDAWRALQQGHYFLAHGKMEPAVKYLRQAIELDPRYASAWAGLGEALATQAGAGLIPAEQGYSEARQAVQRALALDDKLGDSHAVLAIIQTFHDWNWTAAGRSIQRARELEPGDSGILSVSASLARVRGHFDEATALYRHILEIDPMHTNAWKNFGLTLYYAGKYSEAADNINKAYEQIPTMWDGHFYLSAIRLAQSRPLEALEEAGKERHPAFRLVGLALANRALGYSADSESKLNELLQKFGKEAPCQIAAVYASRGDNNSAFEWLERAYAAHDDSLPEIVNDPLLRSIQADARFAELRKRVNLPPIRTISHLNPVQLF
jgi:serine/threonine protein kinase/TolB-like protein/Flp pilus assembly protein TadD